MTIYSRVPGVLLVAAALAAAALGLAGQGLVPVWSVAVVGISLLLSRWLPRALSLSAAIGGFFSLELLLLLVTAQLGLGATVPNAVLWGAVSAVAGALLVAKPAPRLGRSGTGLVIASSASAALLVISVTVAQIFPGALRLSWAMNGDAVNAMGFARRMLADGGIDLASTPQPTPLPFAMSAATMEGGRAALPESMLLEHDVARTAQVWIFVIALACLLTGAIVARTTRAASPRWGLPVTALASTIMLAWYVIGVQFDFGFMNSAFAVTVLLAAWLAYVAGEGHPAATLGAVFALAIVLLAVWSPLVVCVAGLGLVTIVRERALLRSPRLRELPLVIVPALAFVAYAALVTVPGFLAQSSALGSNGGFPPIGPGSIGVIAATALLLSAFTAKSGRLREGVGAVVVIAGFGLGLGYLLLQRQGAEFGWGYYPAKFAWTTSILLIVIGTSFAVELMLASGSSRRWRAVLTVLAAGVVASVLWGPVAPSAQAPLAGILRGGDGYQEAAADIVFDLAGPENGKDLLWRSLIGDYWPNTWLLQIDQPDGDPVKIYSTQVTLSAEQVCSIVDGLGPEAVIHSADPAAEADLDAVCPDAVYTLIHDGY